MSDLERWHLQPLIRFRFAQQIINYLPVIRERVKAAVLSEMQDWLVTYVIQKVPWFFNFK